MTEAHAARVRTLARKPRAPRMKADMMRRSRAKRLDSRTTNHGLAAEVQSLEARSLPTGTVTASLSNGSLTIGGDNLDNSILISVRTTGIYLTGVQDVPKAPGDPATFTQIKFGSITENAGNEVFLTSSLSLKNLTILMRGGNDVVRMNVGVAAGDPNADAPDFSITGRVRFNLGAGNDHSALLLKNGTLTIGGNLEGDLGNGDDCFLVEADPQAPIKVGGNVIVLGRLGKDLIGFDGIDINKSVTLLGGEQDDAIFVHAATVKGNVRIDGYDGNDNIDIENVTITGTTNLLGGAGNDGVRINNLIATGNVAVNMGSGDDLMSVGAITLGEKTKVTLDGSSGHDTLMSDTEPPVKLLSIEDKAPKVDPTDVILSAIEAQLGDCLVALGVKAARSPARRTV